MLGLHLALQFSHTLCKHPKTMLKPFRTPAVHIYPKTASACVTNINSLRLSAIATTLTSYCPPLLVVPSLYLEPWCQHASFSLSPQNVYSGTALGGRSDSVLLHPPIRRYMIVLLVPLQGLSLTCTSAHARGRGGHGRERPRGS